MGRRIRKAYQEGDKEMQEIVRQELPELQKSNRTLHALFEPSMVEENKVLAWYSWHPYGWILQRIKREQKVASRLIWLVIDRIDELEVESLPFTDFYADKWFRSYNSQPVAYYCDSFNDFRLILFENSSNHQLHLQSQNSILSNLQLAPSLSLWFSLSIKQEHFAWSRVFLVKTSLS